MEREGAAATVEWNKKKWPGGERRTSRLPVGRNVRRIGASDVEDYISKVYRRTAERMAAGDLSD
ncbi:hypothetical protein [Arthrobacter sp. H14-L1]|uniref:hypothetical protein n=1 Tax=Arthrobacter sp. H14-L1 TaxID=2996697 RepID=UPI00227080AD|nr:hypothetical protein [Arthrobacter sp. H14-L1]MCY0906554.1 hypothetical protein [Arthrobacter sp. H14-L1]